MTALTPVLKLEPYSYSTQERPLPGGSRFENPEGWNRLWVDSLRDAGIVGLTPTTPGSCLVPLRQVTDRVVLRAVLRRTFEDNAQWDPDQLRTLSGGYVLAHGGREIEPGCCSDLGNLEAWEKAAAYFGEAWSMVWIGHPWTHVRGHAEVVEFAEPSELDRPQATEPYLRLPRRDLSDAIVAAHEEREAFAERLRPAIEEFRPTIPLDPIVEVLTRGYGGP